MVSLNFVVAVFGMVTFGNAKVAFRYLQPSPQKAASGRKVYQPLFKQGGCPSKVKMPQELKTYVHRCIDEQTPQTKTKPKQTHTHTLSCNDQYSLGLLKVIESFFGEDISYISGHEPPQLGLTVQKLFTDYPANGNDVEKTNYIEDVYNRLPGSLYLKDGKFHQLKFGFYGEHAFFLARLAIYISKECFSV